MRKVSDALRRICALALCLCMMGQYLPLAGFAEEGAKAVTEAVQGPGSKEGTGDPANAGTTGTTGGTEPADPSEPTEPTEATAPTEATEATEPTKPTEATEPTKPTKPTEPTQAAEPAEELCPHGARGAACPRCRDIEIVQGLIDGLPGPGEITRENGELVKLQLETITESFALLPQEDQALVDLALYQAAGAALAALETAQVGKTVTAWTWVQPEEEEDRILDPETGEVYLSATQEEPIAMELLTDALPRAILATVEGAEETVPLGPWTCEGYPAGGAFTGDYTFVTTLPEGYTLAEGVAALEVKVRFDEPETLADGTVNNEEELLAALNTGGTITLGADIKVTKPITISGQNITLDLNKKTLTYSGSDGNFMRGASGVFTLESGNFTVRNGTLTQNIGGTYLRCFNVKNGTLTIEGVTIQGFSCLKGGGAISIEQNGTCIMNSGTISNNIAGNDNGGGVYVRGTFNMHDGTISGNNVSKGSGGGVYVANSGTFDMDGGTISGNTAHCNGGGVYVYNSGRFTMEGGTIFNNTANAAGGGVYMYSGSFTMSGGSITGNVAGGDGKGVYIGSSISCQLSGGARITGNTGNGTGNLFILNSGNAVRSITNLTTDAQLRICFSRPEDVKVATGDQTSLPQLMCENEGFVFTLENFNELWVKLNRMEINTQPTGKEGLTYDGIFHELVSAGTAGTSGTMRYAVTLSGSSQPGKNAFSKELPSRKDAGKYTVWYYVPSNGDKADSNMGQLEVTIAQKPLGVNWTKTTLTYNGCPQQPTATLTGRVDNDHVWLKINNPPTDAGTYTTTKEDLKLDGSDAGNYVLADNVQGTGFTIQRAHLTITANFKAITYGEAPDNDGVTYKGLKWTDDERCLEGKLDYTYTYEQYDDVGIYEITPKGLTSNNYDISFVEGLLYVDQKPISINWGETTYTYDGTPWAPSATAGDTVNGDALTLTVTGQETNVGEHIATVTKIKGVKAENYKLPDNPTTSYTITPAEAQFTPPTPKTGLTYTGQAQELIDPGSSNDGTFQYWLDGEQPGESIPQARNAGTYTVHYQLVGDKNHKNGTEGQINVEIAPKDIKGANVTLGKSLTYTGQKLTNDVTGVTIDGLRLGWDDYFVSGNTEATDVGTYSLTVHGTGNFTGTAPETWEIQAVTDNDWTVEPDVTDCTYGVTPTVTMGKAKFGTDTETVEYFQDGKSLGNDVPTNAGNYKAVFTVAETGNYNGVSKTVYFTIAKAPLTVTANPKTITYGEKPANDGVIYGGFVNGEDEKVLKGTLDFDYDYQQYDNVGSYTITPKGLTSGNYDITFTKGTLTVERKNVTIQGVAVEASKVYNGTANATITENGHLSANFDGENLTFHVGTAAYDDKNAGEDKTVTFTGFSLEGPAAGNYLLTGQPVATTASITPMPVALTVTAKDKTYDGTLTAELDTVTHSGFVAGDDVQLVNGTPSFVSKDKGEKVQLTFTLFTLTGTDAGNYALTQPTGVKARISPRPVTVSGITAQNKTYDGNTQVTFEYGNARLDGNVDGDKLTVTAEGSFEDANVGDKLVNITGLTLDGAEQGNYVLAEQGQQTTATAAITANDRYLDLSGLDVGGDPGTVWIDGEKQPINTSGGSHILLSEDAGLLTTYTYSQSSGGNGYPTGMKVYRFRRADTGVTLEEIPEFENLLNYAGCSIRLTGTKGIRMITGISETKRTALIGAQGLAGYTLEEYGTVVMRGVGTPTLENSHSHNFAYKKGKADPVFGRAGGMVQYTNVLVGFSLEDCKDELTLRPYVILKDTATGETVTLYGGCVSRSIGYIAKQNANTYQPGTAGYQYVHQIIDAVYGKTEQGGETK